MLCVPYQSISSQKSPLYAFNVSWILIFLLLLLTRLYSSSLKLAWRDKECEREREFIRIWNVDASQSAADKISCFTFFSFSSLLLILFLFWISGCWSYRRRSLHEIVTKHNSIIFCCVLNYTHETPEKSHTFHFSRSLILIMYSLRYRGVWNFYEPLKWYKITEK